jgi:hypothetical protein
MEMREVERDLRIGRGPCPCTVPVKLALGSGVSERDTVSRLPIVAPRVSDPLAYPNFVPVMV